MIHVLIATLLGAAVVIDVLCCVGLVVMKTSIQRLHFVGPATCAAPWLIGAAVALGTHATADQAGKGLLVALMLTLFAGVLSHETAGVVISRAPGDSV